MDVSFFELDEAVADIAKYFERGTSFSFEQLSLAEMYYVDSKQASIFEQRVKHIINSHSSPSDFARDVNRNSKYKKLLGPLALQYSQNGRFPPVTRLPKPSSESLSRRYRNLTPFLLSRVMGKNVSLIGATSSSDEKMWFAASRIDNKGFDCIGYKGEKRTISFSSLNQMGYSQIANSQSNLKKMCMDEFSGAFQVKEIRLLGLYISKEMKPTFERSEFGERLDEFLSIFPDARSIKNTPQPTRGMK
ncbi:MAG: hypothetical protein CMI54_00815 [Parcubacteria group bacterium]|nr:hypothetical protein [Parcubacteria group bacterium]|tara:strand:- start:1289 stop:2029 length:741 start_codon:yes stop_codon:yes gene_type:complete